MSDYKIFDDLLDGQTMTADEYHALAPSEKPASFDEKLAEIHDMGFDGRYTTLCCVDDGADLAHENFLDDYGGTRIKYSESNVRGETPSTGGNHGTHVLGTMGGLYTGVLPAATLEVYKGLNARGQGTSADLNACGASINQRFRQNKISTPIVVVNMSYGGPFDQGQENVLSDSNELGLACCASAGNSGHSTSRPTCGHPGTSAYVNCSANIRIDGTLSSSSSHCKQVDLASHGTNVLSSIPGNRYGFKTGTSMSSPWMSGICGMIQEWLLSIGKPIIRSETAWTNFWMINAIDAGKRGHDWKYGYGILTFEDILDLIIRKELKHV